MTAKTVRTIIENIKYKDCQKCEKEQCVKDGSEELCPDADKMLEQIRATMPSVEEMIGCYCKWRCTQKDSCSTCPYPYFQMATAIRELIESKLQ